MAVPDALFGDWCDKMKVEPMTLFFIDDEGAAETPVLNYDDEACSDPTMNALPQLFGTLVDEPNTRLYHSLNGEYRDKVAAVRAVNNALRKVPLADVRLVNMLTIRTAAVDLLKEYTRLCQKLIAKARPHLDDSDVWTTAHVAEDKMRVLRSGDSVDVELDSLQSLVDHPLVVAS